MPENEIEEKAVLVKPHEILRCHNAASFNCRNIRV